jgi:hypothetical protein
MASDVVFDPPIRATAGVNIPTARSSELGLESSDPVSRLRGNLSSFGGAPDRFPLRREAIDHADLGPSAPAINPNDKPGSFGEDSPFVARDERVHHDRYCQHAYAKPPIPCRHRFSRGVIHSANRLTQGMPIRALSNVDYSPWTYNHQQLSMDRGDAVRTVSPSGRS